MTIKIQSRPKSKRLKYILYMHILYPYILKWKWSHNFFSLVLAASCWNRDVVNENFFAMREIFGIKLTNTWSSFASFFKEKSSLKERTFLILLAKWLFVWGHLVIVLMQSVSSCQTRRILVTVDILHVVSLLWLHMI